MAAQSEVLSAPAAAPVPSKSLAEAHARARSFFREICRELPWVMENYQLEELCSRPQLRTYIAGEFRKHGEAMSNSQAVDMLLFKGQAEMTSLLAHHTQRHHIITKWIAPSASATVTDLSAASRSPFLNAFLKSNA